MRKAIILISVVSFVCFLGSRGNDAKPSGPVAVSYFLKGDTLLPDYVCADTLIVVDERGLNTGMAMFEQGIIEGTDYQIDSLFHTYCIVK